MQAKLLGFSIIITLGSHLPYCFSLKLPSSMSRTDGGGSPIARTTEALRLSKSLGKESAAARAWSSIIWEEDVKLPEEMRVLGLSLLGDALSKIGQERKALRAFNQIIEYGHFDTSIALSPSTLYAAYMNRGYLLLKLYQGVAADLLTLQDTSRTESIPGLSQKVPGLTSVEAAYTSFLDAMECCEGFGDSKDSYVRRTAAVNAAATTLLRGGDAARAAALLQDQDGFIQQSRDVVDVPSATVTGNHEGLLGVSLLLQRHSIVPGSSKLQEPSRDCRFRLHRAASIATFATVSKAGKQLSNFHVESPVLWRWLALRAEAISTDADSIPIKPLEGIRPENSEGDLRLTDEELMLALVAVNSNAFDPPEWSLLDDKVSMHRLVMGKKYRAVNQPHGAYAGKERKRQEKNDVEWPPWYPLTFEWPGEREVVESVVKQSLNLDYKRNLDQRRPSYGNDSLWVLKTGSGWGGHGNSFCTTNQIMSAGRENAEDKSKAGESRESGEEAQDILTNVTALRCFAEQSESKGNRNTTAVGGERFVLQQYVAPPFLLEKPCQSSRQTPMTSSIEAASISGDLFKFSLRVFVVVIGCDLQRFTFISDSALLKFAQEPYHKESSKGFKSRETLFSGDGGKHVTNSAQSAVRHNEQSSWREPDRHAFDPEDQQFDLSALRQYLEKKSAVEAAASPTLHWPTFEQVWNDTRHAVAECVKNLSPVIFGSKRVECEVNEATHAPSTVDLSQLSCSSYQASTATLHRELLVPKILGVDVLFTQRIDAASKVDIAPMIIEVNRFPGLAPRGIADRRTKMVVVESAWRRACWIHANLQSQHQKQEKKQRKTEKGPNVNGRDRMPLSPTNPLPYRDISFATKVDSIAAAARQVVGLQDKLGRRTLVEKEVDWYYTEDECDASLTVLDMST